MTGNNIFKNRGWIIAEKYKHKGTRYRPIGSVYPDGSYTGYIYVYPTKRCAEIALGWLSSNFRSNFVILKIDVTRSVD